MEKSPQQWAYSALVGMSLLLAGWLWQLVSTLREDVQRLQENKVDRATVDVRASDRWTGAQQAEYRAYVDSRLNDTNAKMDICRRQLEEEIARLHGK